MIGPVSIRYGLGAVFVLVLVACNEPCSTPLTVDGAWVRAPLPNRSMTAAYMTLNSCEAQLEVVGYRSPQFARVELHQTLVENGVSSMQRVDELTLAPGQAVALAPGGMHLMLMRPTAQFEPDSPVEIVLELADGRTVSVLSEVASGPPGQ